VMSNRMSCHFATNVEVGFGLPRMGQLAKVSGGPES
jgi:hypothetical protein